MQNPSLPLKALAEALTGTLYEGLSRERAAMAAELAEADMHTHRAQLAAVAFALAAAVLLAAGATRRGLRRGDMLLVAICCLVPGLCAPVLTLASGTELPLLGRVVLSYEAKSILGVVTGLAQAGAIVPALAVATFSIGVPLVKLLTLAWESVAGAFPSLAGPPGIFATATHHAGRWSMVDVFVVAIVVAFTAGRTGDAGATALGLGVWFFGAYALLSQLSAQVAGSRG